MAQLRVIAHYTVSEGELDEVLALLPRVAEATRQEPGNVSYDVYRALDDERRLVLLESYVSREALDAHRDTPHFQELVAGEIIPRLESRVIELYDVPDEG